MFLNDKRKAVEQVNKKWVRVLTVLIYVISVSLVALVLGLYYRLIWRPNYDFNSNDSIGDLINLNKTISLGTIRIKDSSRDTKEELKNNLINILRDGLKKQNIFVELTESDSINESIKQSKTGSYIFSFKVDIDN